MTSMLTFPEQQLRMEGREGQRIERENETQGVVMDKEKQFVKSFLKVS